MRIESDIQKTFTVLLKDARIQKALEFLKSDHDNTIAEQKEIALVPGAPNTELEIRAPMYSEKLKKYGLEDVAIDEVGNTFGYVRVTGKGPIVVLEGHLDNVFPLEVPLSIREDNGRIYCPGIGDDTAALAKVLSVARAIAHAGLRPCGTLMLGGTVGEEAPGMSRGVRHLMATRSDIDVYIAMETCWTHRITRGGVCCRRCELIFRGPGGHAWNDCLRPSPISAAGRAVGAVAAMKLPEVPKTICNPGLINGGTTVNSIAAECSVHFDIRCTDEATRDAVCEQVIALAQKAADDENAARPEGGRITVAVRHYNIKPGGDQPLSAPIVQIAAEATRAVGVEPNFMPPSSTNINFPLAKGIPCVCIGAGGDGGNLHSPDEWYDPASSYTGAQKALLMLFACAGLEGVTEALLPVRNQ